MMPESKIQPKYTVAFEFTPSMLVSVAEKDISRRERNIEIAEANRQCGARVLDRRPFLRYAYHHRDVRRAKSAANLLAHALTRAIDSKVPHKQKNRRLLYGNPELLRRAIELAKSREGGR